MRRERRQPPIRVLIADDHRLFAEALEAVLSSEERIDVVGRAADGGEAVELARELRRTWSSLDISMPVMDGFEAAAALERLERPPAVLMLTGSNSPEDIDRARRAGVKGYITKDAIAARLVDAILAAAEAATGAATLFAAMLQISAVFQVIVSVALLSLILMHSGRDAGLGGMGFTPASQGGTHIVERNLTRLTVVVAVSSSSTASCSTGCSPSRLH